jgi:ankyrin repeat protein
MTYSPDQNKPDVITVVLKKKAIRYGDDISKNLLVAIEEGDTEQARSLLAGSPNLRSVDTEGDNPLMVAILSKSELVDELLDRTDEIDHRNMEGWTALMYASADGDIKTVTRLLAKGATVDAKNQYGYTSLMLAATRGNPDVVKFLISKGADVNARDSSGRTALALIKGSLGSSQQKEMARLLKNGGGRE